MGQGVERLLDGRRQIGHRTTVELELVGDTRKMKGAVEQRLAERALPRRPTRAPSADCP